MRVGQVVMARALVDFRINEEDQFLLYLSQMETNTYTRTGNFVVEKQAIMRNILARQQLAQTTWMMGDQQHTDFRKVCGEPERRTARMLKNNVPPKYWPERMDHSFGDRLCCTTCR